MSKHFYKITIIAIFTGGFVHYTIGRSFSMWLRALLVGLVTGGIVLVAGILYERQNKRKSGKL